MTETVPTFQVDIWLRGDENAATRTIDGITRTPDTWTDEDVKAMLEGMLFEMHRLKFPNDHDRFVQLRSLSWIVNPYEDGGVVVAIEISLGAAIAGPFNIDKQALEVMITRVLNQARGVGTTTTVH